MACPSKRGSLPAQPDWRAPLLQALGTAAAAMAIACGDAVGTPSPSTTLPPRTFRMGFSALPPKPTNEPALATIDAWSKRADAAIMHVSVPYNALLTGTTATLYETTVDLPLANLYRGKGFPLFVTIDVTDGLNRAAEAPDLVQLHRSITEPAIQQVYRQYVQAIVTGCAAAAVREPSSR